MGRGDARRGGRRALLASSVLAVVGTTGCLSSLDSVLGTGGYETVEIDVQASGIVWSGTVTFESDDGRRVSIPVDRALGSRTYRLPEDIDADSYDAIYPPIAVEVVAERGADGEDPLAVVVRCDGDRCGSASTTAVDEPVRIEVP